MEIAKVRVNGVCAKAVEKRAIPMGIIGATVSFEFDDPMWNDLTKTVVFRGAVTKDVLNAGEQVTIPVETVSRPRVLLQVGIYGTDANGVLAIPTLWADLGIVRDAADPSGDESTDPELPIWAQLQSDINDLKENSCGGTIEVNGASVGQIIKVAAVDENGIPTEWEAVDMPSGGSSDAVQYVEQELTEEQQMQARKNLNLYYNYEEPIVLYEEPATWVDSDHAALPDGTTIGVENLYVSIDGAASGISFLSERLSRNNYTHQWSEYNYAYYGNPYYIADIIRVVKANLSLEVNDNGIPFILYRYDIGNGDSGWLYWYDRSQFSGENVGYDLILSDADNTQTVYELIPEEYLPDSVKNPDVTEAINTALAQAKESGQFDGADGKDGEDYVLTDADKQEIAEQAAQIVDVPSDDHINDLINDALYEIENAAY